MKANTTEIQDGETRFNHIGKGANTAFHIIFILLSILCLAPLVFVIIISFSSEHSVDTAQVLAFTSLAMIPALICFTIFQKKIVGGLTGAVKG